MGFQPTYDNCDEVSDKCPIEATAYGINISEAAPVVFGIGFLICFLAQLYFGFRARTWNFSFWLGLGTVLEGIGYMARFHLARNPWSLGSFAIQYLAILLAPTLVAAAISVTFKSLVIWYGKQWSVMRPALYPWVFVGTDFLSIFIQLIGGAATTSATTGNASEGVRKLGEALLVAGVAFQVLNMICCGGLMIIYIRRRKRATMSNNSIVGVKGPRDFSAHHVGKGDNMATSRSVANAKEAKRARFFVYGLAVAYVAILCRCTYRIAETIPSIARDVSQIEGLFLAFDGAMLLVAVALVSFLHPWNFFPYLGVSRSIRKEVEKGEMGPMPDSQVQPQFHPQQPNVPYQPHAYPPPPPATQSYGYN